MPSTKTIRTAILTATVTTLFVAAMTIAVSASDDHAALPIDEVAIGDDAVVGGSPVPAGKWRDTAGVYFGNQIGCSGVLVAPTVVLTAGHCIDNTVGQVLVGANNVNGPGEVIAVARRIEYPSSWNTYDIGVLVLSTPATVEPRLIATGCVLDRYVADGAAVTIVGYGATDNYGNVYVDELMEAATTITDFDCSDSGKGCMPNARPAGELGAGGGGIDSCFGDSGGPLYLDTEIGDFLIGLTSRGFNDNTLPCSQGGIYVRPDAIIEWIEQQTGTALPRATCNMPPAPTADAISVQSGDTAASVIAPNDPDADDTHVYVLATPPAYGTVEIQPDGHVEYTADPDYEGMDAFTVTVTDNGVPSLSADAQIIVSVESGGGCGCNGARTNRATGLAFACVVFAVFGPRRRRKRRTRA